MSDPLSEVIALLQPRAVFSRRISGAGRWGVAYSAFGHPSFCAVLEGSYRLAVDGEPPLTRAAGVFGWFGTMRVSTAVRARASWAIKNHHLFDGGFVTWPFARMSAAVHARAAARSAPSQGAAERTLSKSRRPEHGPKNRRGSPTDC